MVESSRKAKTHTFSAVVYKMGVVRCVDLPSRIERAIRAEARMPLSGTVGRLDFETSLVPRKEGGFRLFLKMRLLKAIAADVGDRVRVQIRPNPLARKVVMPSDFAMALSREKGAREAYDELPPSHRREFIDWLNQAVKPETRARRLQKAVKMVLERAERRQSQRAARYL